MTRQTLAVLSYLPLTIFLGAGWMEATMRATAPRIVPQRTIQPPSESAAPVNYGASSAPWRKFEVSGYAHGCTMPASGIEHKQPQKTASGAEAEPNWTVAASREFTFGTVLELSHGGIVTTRIVHDRGRAITHGKLDLFMESCERALAWGRRQIMVREVRRPLGRTQ